MKQPKNAAGGQAAGKTKKTKKSVGKAVKKTVRKTVEPLSRSQTFIRLSRGARKGGAFVQRYGKKAMTTFNDFTSGQADVSIAGFVKKHSAFLSGWRFSTFILSTVLLVILMTFFFNNSSIVVDRQNISVAGLSNDFEGYRILVISDLNARRFGDGQVSLMRTINGLSYDLMIMCGDMVGPGGNAQPFYDIIENKTSGAPVYFVAGDCDPGPLVAEPRDTEGAIEDFVLEDWILGAIERGANYIDAPMKLTKGASTLWLSPEGMLCEEASPLLSRLNAQYRAETEAYLGGSEAARLSLPFTAYRARNAQELLDAVTRMRQNDLHIAVSHYPPVDTYNAAAGQSDSGMLRTPDLVLCGHYCGGGLRLPIFGALYVPAIEAPRHGWFPDQSIVMGERLLGNVTVYTTAGLSVTDSMGPMRLRLNNRPQVTLLTLTAALTGDLLGR